MNDNINSTKSKLICYAVTRGVVPGIYDDWAAAKKQVDHYSGAAHQKFETLEEAKIAMRKCGIAHPKLFIKSSQQPGKAGKVTPSKQSALTTGTRNSAGANSPAADNEVMFNLNPELTDGECKHCSKAILPLLMTLIDKVNRLEQAQLKPMSTTSPQPNANNSSIEFKLAAITTKIDSLTNKLNSMKPTSTSTSNPPKIPSPPKFQTAANQQPQPTPTDSHRASKSISQNNFNPERCIVIEGLAPETAKSLNQDIIRQKICQKFGPVIIDLINRYKHNSTKPKFLVQFADPGVVSDVIQRWDADVLNGSSARKTIAPTPSDHLAMLRGVPLDLSDDDLSDAVNAVYPGCSIYRLRSNSGTPLRTAKLEFSSCELRDKAIKEGLHLPTLHLLLRIELPYRPTSIDA